MNYYEAKQEARKERYQELAQKNRMKSDELYKAGSDALKLIPFGQPILVGHHSERADRAYRGRAISRMDKSFEVANKADYYEQRAESVGKAGISSDDPDAVSKLEAKLEKMEAARETMKTANKDAKKAGKELPYAGWPLTNLGANIRSTQKRIEQLQAKEAMQPRADIIGQGFTVHEDKDENRIQFTFPGKPSEAIRTVLKSHSFRWSPMARVWQRMLNNAGRYATDQVIEKLNNIKQ